MGNVMGKRSGDDIDVDDMTAIKKGRVEGECTETTKAATEISEARLPEQSCETQ